MAQSQNCWYSDLGSIDVHYSSGPGNLWFFLLAEGSGTNRVSQFTDSTGTVFCDGRTADMKGIGREVSAKILYRALTVYMTSSTNYAGARVATLNAALAPSGPPVGPTSVGHGLLKSTLQKTMPA